MQLRAPWRALPPTPPTEPLPAPRAQPPDPPPSAPDRRRWWPVAALMVPLLVVAFVAGRTQASDAARPPSADGSPRAAQQQSEPAAGSAPSGEEPAARVAATLRPSVVSIGSAAGDGSGVVVAADGLVLTASHVVGGAAQVTVTLADGTALGGRVVVDRPDLDLAAIRVDADDLVPAALATADPTVGQTAIAIGSPFGFDQTVSSGIVSALDRRVDVRGRTLTGLVQTDAPINPGSSGGPLASRSAEIIGINVVIASRSGGNDGVGFAVPVAHIREVIEQDPGEGATVRPDDGGDADAVRPVPGLPDLGDLPHRLELDLPRFGWLPEGWRASTSRTELRSGDTGRSVRLEAAGAGGSVVLSAESVADAAAEVDRATAGVTASTRTVRGTDARSWTAGGRRLLVWAETSTLFVELTAPSSVGVDDLVRIAEHVDGDLT